MRTDMVTREEAIRYLSTKLAGTIAMDYLDVLTTPPDRDDDAMREKVKELYEELLFAVAHKFLNETRHETALRYIREAEGRSLVGCAKSALAEVDAEGERLRK
jgi:hypothetical protein